MLRSSLLRQSRLIGSLPPITGKSGTCTHRAEVGIDLLGCRDTYTRAISRRERCTQDFVQRPRARSFADDSRHHGFLEEHRVRRLASCDRVVRDFASICCGITTCLSDLAKEPLGATQSVLLQARSDASAGDDACERVCAFYACVKVCNVRRFKG